MLTANTARQETILVDSAIKVLSEALPPTWTVERSTTSFGGSAGSQPQRLDAAIDLITPTGARTGTLIVEARRTFTPRDAQQILRGLSSALRTIAGPSAAILVVAPWLSPRTQELLADQGVNFADLTGNVRINLENFGLYIRLQGATRNPEPRPRGQVSLRGAKAARLLRLLVDVRPPYGVRDLAAAAGLALGYTSRLLAALDREGLIERSRRGAVEDVDIVGLLRRWAESYEVFKTNATTTFVAPAGVGAALRRLAQAPVVRTPVVTGSFAAVELAPIAAPTLLVAYTEDPSAVAAALNLLPAEEGPNVALLRPYDSVVWQRTTRGDDVEYAAPSQVVVDCLTGTGRMPAEGQAVLAWMVANEGEWRLGSLPEVARDSGHAED